jgi:hypothetical protein
MDMPQMFASLRFENGAEQPERQDLLGDVEEIRYLGQKAWGANIALEKAGLYQFIMESRPWWNEAKNHYLQQVCKVVLPVLGQGEGWSVPAGLGFEIVPLTRPFGHLFRARPAFRQAAGQYPGAHGAHKHREKKRSHTLA